MHKLNEAGANLKGALDLKETEIKDLEAKIAKHVQSEEKMEQTIIALNDKINVEKMVNLEAKSENERTHCDLQDAKKETQRLIASIDSLKKQLTFAQQSSDTNQKALNELREKYRQLQEEVKGKTIEIRQYDIGTSQLKAEKNRVENDLNESKYQFSTLEGEHRKMKEELKKIQQTADTLLCEKETLVEEIKLLKHTIDTKEEEMAIMQSQHEDNLCELRNEVSMLKDGLDARQQVVNALTEQLGATTEKSASYCTKIVEESEASAKMRGELLRVKNDVNNLQQECLTLHAFVGTIENHVLFLEERNENLFCFINALTAKIVAMQDTFEKITHDLREECNQRDAEIERMKAREEQLLSSLSETQKKLHTSEETTAQLEKQIAISREEQEALTSELNATQSNLSAMNQKYEESQKQIMEMNNFLGMSRAEGKAENEKLYLLTIHLSSFEESCGRMWRFVSDAQMSMMQEKYNYILETFLVFSRQVVQRTVTYESENRRIANKCKDLDLFIKDMKAAMRNSDIAAAEKHEAQQKRIDTLDKSLQTATKEKENALTQLSSLLQQFETDQDVFQQFKMEKEAELERMQQQHNTTRKECEKLRNGLNYELKRKGEYKVALEEVKKLRDESERNRSTEKSLANDTIQRANQEIQYWIQSFEKLKDMIETSRRTGVRVDPIDEETTHRYELAKTMQDEKLSSQNVNLATVSGEDKTRKRPRIANVPDV
ncbi:BRCT domain-containing protein [Strigomonas culicis]|uniref:BRCT domain-containing protein n=1 Tax=Strigomonas culicis TaxID=28005 RepID=S9TVP6_9TRYP|nr:BRCT domain-containing protein [Strigomonas culicis]|eukprot:EPY20628.1 BRCT domain-containing protein [Strigomonas culicis]